MKFDDIDSMWLIDGNGFTESSVAGWVGEVLPMEEAAIASRQANWNGVLVQQCHWKTCKKSYPEA